MPTVIAALSATATLRPVSPMTKLPPVNAVFTTYLFESPAIVITSPATIVPEPPSAGIVVSPIAAEALLTR